MKKGTKYNLYLSALVIAWLFFSCNSTKYLGKKEYLLTKVEIICNDKNVNKSELENYVKQRPNKKILGVRPYVAIYNSIDPKKEAEREKNRYKKYTKRKAKRSDKGKDTKPFEDKTYFTRWILNIGEEPVVLDDYKTQNSTKQIKQYLDNRGFYNSTVRDSIFKDKETKKAEVYYFANPGKQYKIRTIKYHIEDTSLIKILMPDTVNALIKKNTPFDIDTLQSERQRITDTLKNRGYYYFTKEYIYYKADSAIGNSQIDLTIGVKQFVRKDTSNHIIKGSHKKYYINNTFIYSNYDPKAALKNREEYIKTLKDTVIDSVKIYYNKTLEIKPHILLKGNFIKSGDTYSPLSAQKTYKYFSGIPYFKLINIQYGQPQKDSTIALNTIDCHVQLTPATIQSYSIEVEGTNSTNENGIAGNFIYKHQNLFKRAYEFELKLTGALEAPTVTLGEEVADSIKTTNKGLNNNEYGGEASLKIPKLLFPDFMNLREKYNAKTNISLAYNHQKRPKEYTRTIRMLKFGYYWKTSKYWTHYINPLEFSAIELTDETPEFRHRIEQDNTKYSYEDHVIAALNYSLLYTDQANVKKKDHIYFKPSVEFAGNIPTFVNDNLRKNAPKYDDSYTMFNTVYAQYFKFDSDFRFDKKLNNKNNLVFRFFTGIAYPYGNLKTIPFSKKYYIGGANSIRAWDVRGIGPGTHSLPDTVVPYQTADLKLETNLEYRFKMFWLLEGAVFIDAGNIWAVNEIDDREGAPFHFNTFYKQLAVGSGFGLRLDVSFFIFRTDIGIKIIDPTLPYSNQWAWNKPKADLFVLNFGIGYPF